ncbi:MAG: Nucleoid-associated protein [Chlamydiia bacterium]|nr:Nucleoid-associated protein [Chlamydiia bacterium]
MGSGFSKMKKKQKAMQAQMAEIQKDMENKEIVGTSEGELVKVTLTGTKSFKNIDIDPSCVDPEDIEGLQDLIGSAFKNAEKQADETMGMDSMGPMF